MSEESKEEPGGQEEGALPQVGAAGSAAGEAAASTLPESPGSAESSKPLQAQESSESPEAQESPEPAENKKSRKPLIITLVILLVVCLVGGGIYWFGFRDTTVNQGDSVLTGMKNQPKIVPIAGAKDAVYSEEHNGEIIYLSNESISLWDSNTQKERWRIDNPLPMPGKDSGDNFSFYFVYSDEGQVLIRLKVIKNKGEESENSRSHHLVLSSDDGKVTAQSDTLFLSAIASDGQVAACTADMDLVLFQGKGQIDSPAWTQQKACNYEGYLSLGFGTDTIRVYKDDEQGALYEGSGTYLREILGEYKLSDGSEAEKGYASVNGYRPPEGGRITGGAEYESLKATMVAYTDAQGRQNTVFINKDGKVLYQAKPGYWFHQFASDKKYFVVGDTEAGVASVVDTATWKEITQIFVPKDFNKLFDLAINDRYVWGFALRDGSDDDQNSKVRKLLVYDIKTGKPAPAPLAEINTNETTGSVNTFLTTQGFIVQRDRLLTHLKEDGSKLWELKLPEESFVGEYYKDKKETKPFLAITNSEGVIDSYLK